MKILDQLTSTTTKSQKRVGRGYGSKKGGHTTGRGAKGDKVRGKTKLTFDGTKIKKSWLKRLPFLRGKKRLLPKSSTIVLNLSDLSRYFKKASLIDPAAVIKLLGLPPRINKVKILSLGDNIPAYTIKGISLSRAAREKIIKAGGRIEND